MFYLVLFVPLMVPFVAKFWFKREYTIVEMLINLVMAFAITFAVYQLGSFSATQDTEIRSGQVTSKAKTWTSCEHSYQWAGAKKNDVVMVYGVDPDNNTVQWFQSFSVGNGVENGSLHATLKAMSLGEAVDSKLINMNLDIIKSNFHRVPMERFEYLKDQIQPPLWVIILSLLLGIGSSVGIAFALSNNNIKERK